MNNFLITSSIYVSNIFSPEFLFIVLLFLISISFLYLNIKRINLNQIFTINCPVKIKSLIILLLSIIIAVSLTLLFKFIFKIPRPINMLIDEIGYSFPSGHTATAFSVYFSSIYLLYKYMNNKNYIYSTLFLLIIPVLSVSYSRIILQVHRPIDIYIGVLVGLLSSYLSIKIYYNIITYVTKKNSK